MSAAEDIMYGSASVGPKGQVVIPVKFRNHYNIKPGDTVVFMGNLQQTAFAVMNSDQLAQMQSQLDAVKNKMGNIK